MSVIPAFLIAFLACAAARGSELEIAARGLDATIEELGGSMSLNGLPVSLSRVTGKAVPILAERIILRWSAAAGPDSVLRVQCCGWTVASRIQQGRAEAIQWRIGFSGPELIWSAIALNARTSIRFEEPLPSIVGCTWTAPIGGKSGDREFRQASGRCRGSAPEVFRSLGQELDLAGWHWSRAGNQVIHAQRHGRQMQVVLNAAEYPRAVEPVSLVLIESRPAGRFAP